MKKIVATLSLSLLGAGLLAGCTPATADTLTKETLYGFQAATSVSLLAGTDLEAISPLPAIKYAEGEDEPTDEEEIVFDINKYIGIMEQLLSDDEAPIVVDSVESDREEYAYKMVITTSYLTGDSATYILYYNELTEEEIEDVSSSIEDSEDTSIPEPTMKFRRGDDRGNGHNDGWVNGPRSDEEVDSEDPVNERGRGYDEEDRDDFLGQGGLGELNEHRNEWQNHHGHGIGEFNEDGVLINLEGIVVLNEVEYALVGTTSEHATSFFISLNETNWIRMHQVVTDNMTKYMIGSMIDGSMSRIAFKAQIEEGKTKVSLFTLKDGEVVNYAFRKMIRNDTEVIMIRVVEEGTVTHVIAYPELNEETGEVTYMYEFFESGHGYGFRGHHHGR
ncbi:MAG TPA: hypothetical protein PK340_03255 [Bacilli bacterium]|nr:hypothetical protein [Bacilli bacterium]